MPGSTTRWSREPARYRHARGARVARLALGLGLTFGLLIAGPLPRAANAAGYDRFYANFQSQELMRAINAERAALGRNPLRPDPRLASVARDRTLACPSDGDLTIRGRARDLAERAYLSHDVQGCQAADGEPYSAFDLLAAFGHHWATVGENIASNNYPSTKVSHETGCSPGGDGCNGSIELPWNVAVVTKSWMDSPGHRAVMLSATFERFGCGAWHGDSGHHAYSCYFVAGTGGSVDRAAPAIRDRSGEGASYAAGSTPTFTAFADDRASLLAHAEVLLDGKVLKRWAYDHAGSSDRLSIKVPPLRAGRHTLTWRVRDTSTNLRSADVVFTAGDGRTPPPAKPRPNPDPPPGNATGAQEPVTADPSPTLSATGGGRATPGPIVVPSPGAVAAARSPELAQPRGAVDAVATEPPDGLSGRSALGVTVAGLALLTLISVGLRFGATRRRPRPE